MHYLLPHLVDASAGRLPQAEAIRCRGESLTWSALASRSNSLAHLLAERGVRRGDRVGILLGKCVECAVALHGIMKAGAAYVPLDPAAPPERQAFVLRDCGVQHLVTEPRRTGAAHRLAERTGLRTLIGAAAAEPEATLTVDWDSVYERRSDSAPTTPVMEQDLAYILYTSGSTGTPKGIMHTHRSGLAWAEVSAATYGLTESDRISNYAPLHFDLSTLDYFAAALVGAATVVIPEEHTLLPASLSKLIADEALTVFYTVPLALTRLALSGTVERNDLKALRWILFGGEPMPTKYLAQLMRALPHVRFSNVYGPTETNGCTYHVVAAVPEDGEPVPIGKPYANVEALVVDAEDREVAAGQSGELLIRAPTTMQGYWGRADLNDRAFYSRRSAVGLLDCFHRTGDLVRALPSGDLQFIGRKDRQIKTRGCRVDLDEVEAILVDHSAVREAAVYPVADADGHLLIRASVIPTEGSEISERILVAHLQDRLPAYAVPVGLALVDDFPRTSSGKIDRLVLSKSAGGA